MKKKQFTNNKNFTGIEYYNIKNRKPMLIETGDVKPFVSKISQKNIVLKKNAIWRAGIILVT